MKDRYSATMPRDCSARVTGWLSQADGRAGCIRFARMTGTPSGGDMRPVELAEEIGVAPIRIRTYLRWRYPRASEEHGTSWDLGPDQVAEVRAAFASGDLHRPTAAQPTITSGGVGRDDGAG